jgi:hypothetical protein
MFYSKGFYKEVSFVSTSLKTDNSLIFIGNIIIIKMN